MQLIYGKHPVNELAKSNVKVTRVFTVDWNCKISAVLKKQGAEVVVLTKGEFNRRFPGKDHQGIVAQVAPFEYKKENWLEEQPVAMNSLIVLLDGIEDPQNLGAIARSACAAGATALLLRKDRQASVTPAAIKASAGYLVRLDVVQFTNAAATIKSLKKLGYWVVGAVGSAKQNYQSVDPNAPLVVVIGNEHSGISRLVAEQLDFPVSIPMAEGVDSLNASAAAAVILMDLYNRKRVK